MVTGILAACGNNCATCPRYAAPPFEKTPDELRHTAELWKRIGYRDRVVSVDEIACQGCRPSNWCRYGIAVCCAERGIDSCAACPAYPCAQLQECFEVTKSFEPACRHACTGEEYALLQMAFLEKESRLEQARQGLHSPQPTTD